MLLFVPLLLLVLFLFVFFLFLFLLLAVLLIVEMCCGRWSCCWPRWWQRPSSWLLVLFCLSWLLLHTDLKTCSSNSSLSQRYLYCLPLLLRISHHIPNAVIFQGYRVVCSHMPYVYINLAGTIFDEEGPTPAGVLLLSAGTATTACQC